MFRQLLAGVLLEEMAGARDHGMVDALRSGIDCWKIGAIGR